MCGIAGWVGNPADSTTRLKVALLMQTLFFTLQKRGKDGAGLLISDAERHHVVKKALTPTEFVQKGFTTKLFEDGEYGYMLAHARAATDKKTTGVDKNCHPFAVLLGEGLFSFGIHNGQVGAIRLVEKYGVKAASVDSETLFRTIALLQRRGMDVEEAICDVINDISDISDLACAYLNTGEPDPAKRCLYLWRTPMRPLCIIDAREIGLGRFFCSTEEIFRRAWGFLRGYLGPSSKLKFWEAKSWRLYRVAADGVNEVHAVKEIPHAVNVHRATHPDPDGEIDGDDDRGFHSSYRHFSLPPTNGLGYEPYLAEYIYSMTGEEPEAPKETQLSLFKGGVKGLSTS